MSNKNELPSNMWEAARIIWENTPGMSSRDLLDRLKEVFGEDKAPSSPSTITRRIKKEGWKRNSATKGRNKGIKSRKKDATNGKNELVVVQNTQQNTQQNNSTQQKSNNANDSNGLSPHATAEEKVMADAEKLALSSEERKHIILKHRKRLRQLGTFQDQTIDTAQMLNEYDLESKDDDEKIQKVIVITETLSRTLAQLSSSQKMIAEQEFVICGITADDFKQSEQERRLGALEALDGIEEEERIIRETRGAELRERLKLAKEIEQDLDNSDEIIAAYKDKSDDSTIEDAETITEGD